MSNVALLNSLLTLLKLEPLPVVELNPLLEQE